MSLDRRSLLAASVAASLGPAAAPAARALASPYFFRVVAAAADAQGRVVVGTNEGVYLQGVETPAWRHVFPGRDRRGPFLQHMALSRSGTLASVASGGTHLYSLSTDRWRTLGVGPVRQVLWDHDGRLYGWDRSHEVWVAHDGGWRRCGLADAPTVRGHAASPGRMQLLVADRGLWQTRDGGISWAVSSEPLPGGESLEMQQGASGWVFLVSRETDAAGVRSLRFHASARPGRPWVALPPPPGHDPAAMDCALLAVQGMRALFRLRTGSDAPVTLWRADASRREWQALEVPFIAGQAWMSAGERVLLAWTDTALYRSDDAGGRWATLLPDMQPLRAAQGNG